MLVGLGGVGKSAMVIQFVTNHFVEEYDPTIEDSYRKVVEVDGKSIPLEIYDTAGREEYSVMREQFMGIVSGFLLVYSITNRESFEELSHLYEQIKRVKDTNDPIVVLCGNKSDLTSIRQVRTEEAEQLALELNVPFFETSAKKRTNIEEAILTLVKRVKKKLPEPEPIRSPVNPPPPKKNPNIDVLFFSLKIICKICKNNHFMFVFLLLFSWKNGRQTS